MKLCSKCKVEKNLSEFGKDKTKKDGLCIYCKKCKNQSNKQYYEQNKEYQKQYKKQYYEQNKEYQKQYYEQNKEYQKQYKKQYYEQNKEYQKQYNKQYREQNKEYIKQYKKQYYEQNKEYQKQYNKQYREQNKRKNRNREINPNQSKFCPGCQSQKSNKDFRKNATTTDGLGTYCKKCFNCYSNCYRKQRLKNDEQFWIKTKLRRRLSSAFRQYSTIGKIKISDEYGINWQAICEHLGPCPGKRRKYHIDHIIPLSAFNFDDPKQVKAAFAPENHQWLTIEENLSKSNSIDEQLIVKFNISHLTGSLK